jgi:hypothetical protein
MRERKGNLCSSGLIPISDLGDIQNGKSSFLSLPCFSFSLLMETHKNKFYPADNLMIVRRMEKARIRARSRRAIARKPVFTTTIRAFR